MLDSEKMARDEVRNGCFAFEKGSTVIFYQMLGLCGRTRRITRLCVLKKGGVFVLRLGTSLEDVTSIAFYVWIPDQCLWLLETNGLSRKSEVEKQTTVASYHTLWFVNWSGFFGAAISTRNGKLFTMIYSTLAKLTQWRAKRIHEKAKGFVDNRSNFCCRPKWSERNDGQERKKGSTFAFYETLSKDDSISEWDLVLWFMLSGGRLSNRKGKKDFPPISLTHGGSGLRWSGWNDARGAHGVAESLKKHI